MFKRYSNLRVGILICAVVLGISCGLTIEDPEGPATPNWVRKTVPEAVNRQGIGPNPEGNQIILLWHPNQESDLEGYQIFRAAYQKSSDYIRIADINVWRTSGVDTLFIDDSVNLNVDYFYYLKSYDQALNESAPSDTIRYRLIEKVEPYSPIGTINSVTPMFQWHDYLSAAYEYVIRIEKLQSREVIWISRFSRPNYADFDQSVKFNADQGASQTELTRGESYQWRIDAIAGVDQQNRDIAGSTSIWGYFTIQR
jgi:hypothetical protein